MERPEFRRLEALPTDAIAPLLAASTAEGFRFVERMVREWDEGTVRFDRPGELLLAADDGINLVAIGGLTADPYTGDPTLGRLRHIYVRPDLRRRGTGRRLVQALERAGQPTFRALVLRTDNADASHFYENLGYERLAPGGTATHWRSLNPPD
jgi:ribosomal protein S18 acetylase RimI-like enzyme